MLLSTENSTILCQHAEEVSASGKEKVCHPSFVSVFIDTQPNLPLYTNARKSVFYGMARILIADDEAPVCSMVQRALWNSDIAEQVDVARDGPEALRMLTQARYDVAILDIFMPGMNGLEVARAARQNGTATAIIILTGKATVDLAAEAVRSEVQDFLLKPIRPKTLVDAVRGLLEKRHPTAHALASQIDQFLKDDMGNPTLQLSDVCERFRISVSYATQLFRKQLHSTFRRRLAFHRIELAKELLTTTDNPLYFIAQQCGFKSPARFTETLTRLEKISPKQYRNLHRPDKKPQDT